MIAVWTIKQSYQPGDTNETSVLSVPVEPTARVSPEANSTPDPTPPVTSSDPSLGAEAPEPLPEAASLAEAPLAPTTSEGPALVAATEPAATAAATPPSPAAAKPAKQVSINFYEMNRDALTTSFADSKVLSDSAHTRVAWFVDRAKFQAALSSSTSLGGGRSLRLPGQSINLQNGMLTIDLAVTGAPAAYQLDFAIFWKSEKEASIRAEGNYPVAVDGLLVIAGVLPSPEESVGEKRPAFTGPLSILSSEAFIKGESDFVMTIELKP